MTRTESQRRSAVSGQPILLHQKDNILVCARAGHAGDVVIIDGQPCVLAGDIPIGHKIARVPLGEGETVFRYGMAIGSMTSSAQPGEHVHSHNLKSDYIAAHGRDAVRTKDIR